MGTKLCELDTISIGKNIFKIELNEGNKEEKYNIHIQNETFKLCYKEEEFALLVAAFLVAKKKFNKLKGKDDE